MYLNHYGLDRKPFEKLPNLEFLWLGEKHRKALIRLRHGILENSGVFVITGDVGTGKTALAKCFPRLLGDAAAVVTVPDPDMEALDFFNYLADGLGMNRLFPSKGEFLIHFKRMLKASHADKRKILLIVDEAQQLTHELLQEIRLLANIHVNDRPPLSILLVGQLDLANLLDDPRAANVRQRIADSYHIQPLSSEEIVGYILQRIQAAGCGYGIFTRQAVEAIFLHTGGYPRLINILCDHALLSGYVAGKKVIDSKLVLECAQELNVTFEGQFPAFPQAEKAADAGETQGREPAPVPKPASELRPYQRLFSMKKLSCVFAAALLLWVSGHALSSRFSQPVPAKTENEMAVQTLARMLSEQPEETGGNTPQEMPFGHELGEDAAGDEPARGLMLMETSEPEKRIVRRKIEIPAAHRIEIAETP